MPPHPLRTRPVPLRAALAALAALALVMGVLPLRAMPASAAPAGTELVAFSPFRAADTRAGLGVRAGKVPAGGVLEVPVAGRLGVPANPAAVVVNVTGVEAAAAGDLTVWPCGAARPAASTLRLWPGGSAAARATVGAGSGGRVCVHVTQSAHVLLDVSGFSPAGSPLQATGPARVYDSGSTPVAAGAWRSVQIAGKGGVPADAVAAAINLTVVGPKAAGKAAVEPACRTGAAPTSTVNFAAGQQVAGSALVRLSGGKVCVWASQATRILVDVQGYAAAASAVTGTPGRLLNTQGGAAPAAGSVTAIQVGGRAGVPADAGAVFLSVKAVSPATAGLLAVYPCGDVRQGTSTTSYPAGRTTAGAALSELGPGGTVCVYTSKQVHLVVDATAWVPAARTGAGATAVSARYGYACTLMPGGAVKCWVQESPPTAVPGVLRAVDLAVGNNRGLPPHGCAALLDGTVRCWGGNGSGQLGDGTTTDRPAAVQVAGVSGATKVAAGDNHSCAIVTGGAVRCWGSGFGTAAVAVPSLAGATAIAAVERQTCAIVAGGAVRCVEGAISAGPVGGVTGARALSISEGAGGCALVVGGAVRCWRDGGAAVAVPSLSGATAVTTGSIFGATVLSAAHLRYRDHGCAVVAGGAVRCWGNNYYGQLGQPERPMSSFDPSAEDIATPVAVPGLSGATAVSSDGYGACALVSGGNVRCWGSFGVGLAQTAPVGLVVPTGLTGVVAADTAGSHTCALVSGGAVRCWGLNDSRQLGVGSKDLLAPAGAVAGLTGASALAVGGQTFDYDDGTRALGRVCAVVGGSVRCWGNGYGSSPVAVPGLSQVTGVAAGSTTDGEVGLTGLLEHTCALTSAGAVRCWGANRSGQLGDGTRTDRPAPVAVSGLASGITAVAAGPEHACALRTDGQVRCWGANASGELGDGTTSTRTAPVAVKAGGSALTGVVQIAAGRSTPDGAAEGGRTCARKTDGTVWCWGKGFGTAPKQVAGAAGATAVSSDCAVVAGGAVTCWETGSSAVAVPGLTGARTVSSRDRVHVAVLGDGTVRSWGSPVSGILGGLRAGVVAGL
jgi:alpha-tubulin suppressor-like RCC1 family protein